MIWETLWIACQEVGHQIVALWVLEQDMAIFGMLEWWSVKIPETNWVQEGEVEVGKVS